MTELELTRLINQLKLEDEVNVATVKEVDNSAGGEANWTDRDGWVQVKDQTIVVRDPDEGGKPPLIRAEGPVRLIVNGQHVQAEVAVSSKDSIRWEIEEKSLFGITVSKNKLHAHFHLHAKERCAWRLTETARGNKLTIAAEENKEIVLATVHLSDVVGHIELKAIRAVLDIAAIQRELEHPTYKPVLIAAGKEAVPGKDAELEIYFSEQVESQFFEVSGTVDFRNHLQIPTVGSGELIARKLPPVDGIPGYDVYGNVIVPAAPKDIMIVAKPSVEWTADGKIKALKSGRPRITGGKIKTFDISTSYVVYGDVDIETGNIVFAGDVIVYGNVTDHMIIESLGNVYVYGNVYQATITATGSVYVRGNVLGSKLYCGYFGVMFNRLYNASKILSEQIAKLQAASLMLQQTLEAKNSKVRYGQIVILLMENKFKDIPATVVELLSIIASIRHIKQKEYGKLQEMCALLLQPAQLLEVATASFVQSIVTLLQETHQEVARMQEEKSEIKLNQCHRSELKSNGDILVENDGVVSSDLFAAGDIVFVRDTAVCRGSSLEAGGSITAKTIGGQTGVGSLLKAKKHISVQKMLSGRICIGKYCRDIFEPVENMIYHVQDVK
ncbi:FapA family protein [Paenibacillus cymbidii]|uniref:FapA family protein n=1 Tax=Paenibacillus cymbidii TaxID=1639034 RepID=UPI001436761C|nr:FapA family protein [Paenibacillus cymbidii]